MPTNNNKNGRKKAKKKMCYEAEFCSKCGRYVPSNTSTIRAGRDSQPEIICNECIAIEQTIEQRELELVCAK